MAIKKDVAGVEDLALGTGTRQQQRNGKVVTITEINADKIPYDATQSTKKIVSQNEYAIRSHVTATGNVHSATPNDIGCYGKNEHIIESTGPSEAGRPVITDTTGKLHPSVVPMNTFTYMGEWTPAPGAEYPDIGASIPEMQAVESGSFWVISGVDATNGYTFTGGDLAGETVRNGDYIVYTDHGWLIKQDTTTEDVYYRDGRLPMIADVQFGGFKAVNMANGTVATDGAAYGQLQAHEADHGNPHQVTKAQVGLSNVPNLNTTDAVNNEHTHSNMGALDNIIDTGSGDNYLADDGTYKPVSGGGGGDMAKAVYDTNDNGVVDNAEQLGGVDAADYALKTDIPTVPSDTDDLPEGGTHLYYTEARVSANADVAANTADRHNHTNKALLDTLTDGGTGNNFLADDGTYKGIGSNKLREWVDETVNRALQTEYTNNTSSEMIVRVVLSAASIPMPPWSGITTPVSAMEIDGITVWGSQHFATSADYAFVSEFTIPPGSTYKCLNDGTLHYWAEFKEVTP